MFLVGDVGGTKVRLALYESDEGRLVRRQTEKFMSSDYRGLDEIVRIFLGKNDISVMKSCFGVPGPIMNGEAHATNLPWTLKEEQLSRALDIPEVTLVNDLVATAAAVPYLTPEDVFTLYEGDRSKSRRNCGQTEHNTVTGLKDTILGVLAPGTGLGQAFLSTHLGKYSFWASEGGHADFAPSTEIEIELLVYLQSQLSHVSYERVLSGPGLVNIYRFLKDKGYAEEPPELKKRLCEEDASFVISSSGRRGEYKLCVRALEIFASILGAQAGNMVLTMLATGGIYVGGGIAVNVYEKLAEGITVDAYLRKGRLAHLVESTPLHVILDDHAALLGAASLLIN